MDSDPAYAERGARAHPGRPASANLGSPARPRRRRSPPTPSPSFPTAAPKRSTASTAAGSGCCCASCCRCGARRPARPARRFRRRSAPRRRRARAVDGTAVHVRVSDRTHRARRAGADDTIGATSEPWPLVAQLVRRASFDLLAAYTERAQLEPSDAAIIDKLTTLYTRPLFDAVLAKELERAGRFGYPISLILFDVDRLSAINQEHGYGVGDKILERLGILIRQYFRQHDWVARYSEDSIAVLLSRTDAEHASSLAERVRATVEERLGFTDHRSDRAVPVTLSAAVINVRGRRRRRHRSGAPARRRGSRRRTRQAAGPQPRRARRRLFGRARRPAESNRRSLIPQPRTPSS